MSRWLSLLSYFLLSSQSNTFSLFSFRHPSLYHHHVQPIYNDVYKEYLICLHAGEESSEESENKRIEDIDEDSEDNSRKLSRDRAISALSQPTSKNLATSSQSQYEQSKQSKQSKEKPSIPSSPTSPASTILPPPIVPRKGRPMRHPSSHRVTTIKRPKRSYLHRSRPPSDSSAPKNKRRRNDDLQVSSSQQLNSQKSQVSQNSNSFSSLLPPPLDSFKSSKKGDNYSNDGQEDPMASGLSSWEEFLGGKRGGDALKNPLFPPSNRMSSSKSSESTDRKFTQARDDGSTQGSSSNTAPSSRLPSIGDLFPPDLTSSVNMTATTSPTTPTSSFIDDSLPTNGFTRDPKLPSRVQQPHHSLDGVLPVSDLFYRSSQSIETDDEELPFSAEQSDQISTDHNKIKIRRNQAESKGKIPGDSISQKFSSKATASGSTATAAGGGTVGTGGGVAAGAGRRKMVRRGMEMLVGGVPINADPPQRSIELWYENSLDWAGAITINSRDFGPILHASSVDSVIEQERGLYCEHFIRNSMKWDVCPKDLKLIVKEYYQGQGQGQGQGKGPGKGQGQGQAQPELIRGATNSTILSDRQLETAEKGKEEESILSLLVNIDDQGEEQEDRKQSAQKREKATKAVKKAAKGFGKNTKKKSSKKYNNKDSQQNLRLGGELVFSIGVSRDDLESGEKGGKGGGDGILRQVLTRGIKTAIQKDLEGFCVTMSKLVLKETDSGLTSIVGEFSLEPESQMNYKEMEKKAHLINSALAQAMDDGDMQLAMAASARNETKWPESVRDQVVEEFLFEDDDEDEDEEVENEAQYRVIAKVRDTTTSSNGASMATKTTTVATISRNIKAQNKLVQDLLDTDTKNSSSSKNDGPFGVPGSPVYAKDDLYLGGGNDGVFYDHSIGNIQNAPYKGELGPLLLDAAVQRAKQRYPRVIAVGDVHGCIDELQDLLRQCDYQPGDLVVFLGDLVSKGPDSISVVQMAREIGAIGVRGNHDFEVIRWHQAIKSGVDPPVVGSEHFHVASCLSKADMKWLYSLPWFISSKELGALFVHAGFVSGIRLAKQNPRLMMNMRSILPDGTVTSKFFNNWPWARLWDGPQTVLFGHDADRGLQQYEHAIGLDTGCVYGGRLTACILPEKRLVSVSARREYFKYRRKHYD